MSTERALVHRLACLVEKSLTKRGHLAQRVEHEGLGYCGHRRCSKACVEARLLLIEAAEYLEAERVEPEQIGLFGEAAG